MLLYVAIWGLPWHSSSWHWAPASSTNSPAPPSTAFDNPCPPCSFLGPPRRRYFICDKKLAALGWSEKTGWEEGLRRTVEWYLKHSCGRYWDNGDMERALDAHPTLQVASSAH